MTALSRRRVLAALVGAAAAACSSGGAGRRLGAASTTTTARGPTLAAGDAQLVVVAASVENLASTTYQTVLSAVSGGKLGTVAPAITSFVQAAMAHHRDHAAAWNGLLTASGRPAVTGVDTALQAVIAPAVAGVKDGGGAVRLALQLEQVAAATCLSALQVFTSADAVGAAASIQPVEMQHLAVANLLLGQYPVPDDFATLDGARPATDGAGVG